MSIPAKPKRTNHYNVLFNTLAKPLDLTHPDANMFGAFPCPYCQSIFRWPNQKKQLVCDDCGLEQPLE